MKLMLTNGCSSSQLSINPKNWYTKTAKISKDWFISYRFYDPAYEAPKQVVIKGMNYYKTLGERQRETERLIQSELEKLYDGFNPFNNISEKQIQLKDNNISEHSGKNTDSKPTIIEALRLAFESLCVAQTTKTDIEYTISLTEKALSKLGLQDFKISEVSRKHIKSILKTISNTSDRFNKYRSYLMILFSELCEDEVVDMNPVRDIKKKKVVKSIRKVLSNAERIKVNEYLQKCHPEFHRFLHIFFHSGTRISELMKVTEADVDITNQRFKIIIQKGTEYREVWKTIKDVALPFWKELVPQCEKDEYLFSKGLKPGKRAIQPYQINKRWYRLVKKKLGIQADFYSLKHLHTTEVVEFLNEEQAAKHNDHISTSMVNKVYDVRKVERENNKIKGLNNPFAT